MDHNAFFKRISAGNVSGIFLFHGDEEYIKQSALRLLTERIDPAARDMNINQYKAPLCATVLAACETLPFFSDRRVVVAYEMADSEVKQLFACTQTMPETTTLIIYMRGTAKKDILKLANDRDVQFSAMSEQEALRFLEKRARGRGITIGPAAARLLIEMVGLEAYVLENEFSKAADYAGDGNAVTAEILRACVTPHVEYKSFQMLDQLIAGKKADALRSLRHMLQDNSGSAFLMAHFFTSQLKNMLIARLLIDSKVREQDIAVRMGVKPWSARTAVRGAKRMSAQKLRGALNAFAAVDYMQVSGQMPADRAIELAVMRYF